MSDSLRLFRGDASKIREFEINKTNKHCLVGQGIYLTNKEQIATTYRTKGSGQCIFSHKVSAKDKPDAIAKAVSHYHEHTQWNLGLPWHQRKNWNKLSPESQERVTQEFKMLLDSGDIAMVRNGYWQRGKEAWDFTFTQKTDLVGWMSVFEFPEPLFTRNCLNVDALDLDKGFLDMLDDRRFWNLSMRPEPADTKRSYDPKSKTWTYLRYQENKSAPKLPTYYESHMHRRNLKLRTDRLQLGAIHWNKLIPVLKEYGMHGFEYSGGRHLGGASHRAFSIWDEDFVNDHKVLRKK